jgi:hypothetical protein
MEFGVSLQISIGIVFFTKLDAKEGGSNAGLDLRQAPLNK